MTSLLLLSPDLGRAVSRHSQRSGSLSENALLIAVALGIAAFWTVLYFWDQHRKRQVREARTPDELFQELCHAHRLGRHERALLQRTVAAHRLTQPALLFIEPDLLTIPTGSGDPGGEGLLEDPDCLALREKLFGAS